MGRRHSYGIATLYCIAIAKCFRFFNIWLGSHLPIVNVAINPYRVLFVAKSRHVLQMLRSDNTAMGRFCMLYGAI